jgi:hypothetical protein
MTDYPEVIPLAWYVGLPEKWFWAHFDLSGFREIHATVWRQFRREGPVASILKRTGIILSVAGVLWFCYVIGERYHDPVPEISPVFAAMALAAAFVGLLVVALSEVCRILQAIEVNTRKQA